MKKYFLFAIFYIACECLWAQLSYSEKELVNYFKRIELPFTTKQLYNTYNGLPYELSLKYFFKNDSISAYYYYEIENMEDFSIMESGYKRKEILPYNFYQEKDKLFLVYALLDNMDFTSDPYTFLSIWKDGIQIDSIIISHETISAPVSYNTIKSKIYKDKVIVFDYTSVGGKKRNEQGIKTEIEVSFYSIDLNRGKFVKTKIEVFNSKKYELYQFDDGKIEGVKEEDPWFSVGL